MIDPNCPYCQGEGWVCEWHRTQAWGDGDGCCQKGAGAPCQLCNSGNPKVAPDMSPGTVTILSKEQDFE
jgi:hypothetical protein